MSKPFCLFAKMRVNYFGSLVLLLLSFWICPPHIGLAAIDVDGRLDEPEWADAKSFRDFVLIDPLTLATPSMATEALVLATGDGLAVAMICEQPSSIERTHTVTSRDAHEFDSDNVTLVVDFDGTGKTAYEFGVSLSGSYLDGTIADIALFSNTDWDPVWQRGVHEEAERWTVEILLPWSIATMRGSNGDTRRIGLFFSREVQDTKEVFGYPGVSRHQQDFMSNFTSVEVPHYSAQQLDVVPYVTAVSDLVKDSTTVKAGLDVFWKPSSIFQVAATFFPDFGHVESDELVINFTAFESFFSDKRPFFTENQSIFDISMPSSGGGGPGSGSGPAGGGDIFYTRRIGGPRDDNREASDIMGAVKVIGSAGPFSYGLFAAEEDEDAGRSYYAGRMTLPTGKWSFGWFTTYTERPFLDRTGLVNAFDYDFRLGGAWRWKGQVIRSDVKTLPERSTGEAFWSVVEYTVSKDQNYSLTLDRYDDRIDLNDMGFLRRNDAENVSLRGMWQQNGFSENTAVSSITWSANGSAGRNMAGDVFPANASLNMSAKTRIGSEVMLSLSYASSGYDDTISRGNGLVRLTERLRSSINYSAPRRGAWKNSFGISASQEGIEKWGVGLDANVVWYPGENLNLDLRVEPSWSRDWLIWVQDTQLGSFSRRQVTAELSANWFPAMKHEVRLKTQWATVDAEAEQSYDIGAGGRLIPDSRPLSDFAQINFGLQLRYRYEIGPLSDFYLVYSRGGFDFINDPDRDTMSLLWDSTRLRDSDQILAKLRYCF